VVQSDKDMQTEPVA